MCFFRVTLKTQLKTHSRDGWCCIGASGQFAQMHIIGWLLFPCPSEGLESSCIMLSSSAPSSAWVRCTLCVCHMLCLPQDLLLRCCFLPPLTHQSMFCFTWWRWSAPNDIHMIREGFRNPSHGKILSFLLFPVMSASVTVIFGRKIAFLVKSYVRYKGRGTSLMECLLFHFGNDATSHQSSSWMLICVFKTVDVWSISAFSLSQPRVPLKNQLEPPLRLITAQSPPMNGEIVVWRDNKYDSLPILLTFPLLSQDQDQFMQFISFCVSSFP